MDVLNKKAGQLGQAQASLEGEQEQGVVTSTDQGGAVGSGQEGLDLGPVEEGDQGALEALERDGEDALDERGVFGVVEGCEVEEGVDGGETGIAGADGVASNGLEMSQKVADERGVEVVEVEAAWGLPSALVNEGEQQAEGVAVGSDGVRTGLALLRQPVGEEGLEGGSERAHGS